MWRLTQRFAKASLLGLAALALAVPGAHGQVVQTSPAFTFPLSPSSASPSHFNAFRRFGHLGMASPFATAFGNRFAAALPNLYGTTGLANGFYGGAAGASPFSSAYGNSSMSGYGSPYGSNYYMDPNYGYLKGGADLVTAQAGFLTSRQQANGLRLQADAERVASRRKAFDEYLYERHNTPTGEEERQRSERQQLSRSLHKPPQSEIWSGKALNDILADLRQRALPPDGMPLQAQAMRLNDQWLPHLNVTVHGGNAGLLKQEGHLDWPVALTVPDFQAARERLTEQALGAVRQVKAGGRIEPDSLRRMLADVDEMQQALRGKARTLSAAEYLEAKAFLNHLDEALQALRGPDVGRTFTWKAGLHSGTVTELVQAMSRQGLQFAAAQPGDEAAYSSLYQALADYRAAAEPPTAER